MGSMEHSEVNIFKKGLVPIGVIRKNSICRIHGSGFNILLNKALERLIFFKNELPVHLGVKGRTCSRKIQSLGINILQNNAVQKIIFKKGPTQIGIIGRSSTHRNHGSGVIMSKNKTL